MKLAFFVYLCCVVTVATRRIKCYNCEVKQGEFNEEKCDTCNTLGSCFIGSYAGLETRRCNFNNRDGCEDAIRGSGDCYCTNDLCNGDIKCYQCVVKPGEFNKEKCDTCNTTKSCFITYSGGMEKRGCGEYRKNSCVGFEENKEKMETCTCIDDFCNHGIKCYQCEVKPGEFNEEKCDTCNTLESCFIDSVDGMEIRGCYARYYGDDICKDCLCNDDWCNDSNPLIASKILAVIVLPIVARLLITTF